MIVFVSFIISYLESLINMLYAVAGGVQGHVEVPATADTRAAAASCARRGGRRPAMVRDRMLNSLYRTIFQ